MNLALSLLNLFENLVPVRQTTVVFPSAIFFLSEFEAITYDLGAVHDKHMYALRLGAFEKDGIGPVGVRLDQ